MNEILGKLGLKLGGDQYPRIRFHCDRLGIDYSHIGNNGRVIALEESPWTQDIKPEYLRRASLTIAMSWFLERGYNASIPIEPAFYDFIVESEDGLKTIQVKSTTQLAKSGHYWLTVTRNSYIASATELSTNGKRQQVSYTDADFDYVFILTGDRSMYLIPVNMVTEKPSITLNRRFVHYKLHSGIV